MELYITLGIIIVGVFLFVKEYFSIDTTSLLIMGLFIVTGVLSPEQGFSGFVHPATVTLACMFVLSAGYCFQKQNEQVLKHKNRLFKGRNLLFEFLSSSSPFQEPDSIDSHGQAIQD